jgi:hypothetical protein
VTLRNGYNVGLGPDESGILSLGPHAFKKTWHKTYLEFPLVPSRNPVSALCRMGALSLLSVLSIVSCKSEVYTMSPMSDLGGRGDRGGMG